MFCNQLVTGFGSREVGSVRTKCASPHAPPTLSKSLHQSRSKTSGHRQLILRLTATIFPTPEGLGVTTIIATSACLSQLCRKLIHFSLSLGTGIAFALDPQGARPMSSCRGCQEALVLQVEDESGPHATVPDDVKLPCGCHFHW
jgi:hypothetical protein